MSGFLIRRCPCGKEIGFGRRTSKFCSEACYDKYGERRAWLKDMSIESKIAYAKKENAWAKDNTDAQIRHWYGSHSQRGSPLNNKNIHGIRFIDAFDMEYRLMDAEIVGLMYRLQRYAKKG